MRPYLTPSYLQADSEHDVVTRKAYKTGLIAWQSNKYSVPMVYQSARVGVKTETGQLIISDLETGDPIAKHLISIEKGQIIKNTDHYRDKAQRIKDLETDILPILGDTEQALALCALLKTTSPKIYKDQLLGAKQILSAYCQQYGAIEPEHLSRLINTPRLTATGLKERLLAFQQTPERNSNSRLRKPTKDQVNRGHDALAHYAALNDHLGGQGENHVIH